VHDEAEGLLATAGQKGTNRAVGFDLDDVAFIAGEVYGGREWEDGVFAGEFGHGGLGVRD